MMTKKTLLIVDDSISDIRLLVKGLSQFAILMAKTGKQAIEIAIESVPDIILMDVEMPEMNGYEASQAIKANEITKNIPILFVSSHDTIAEMMQGYESGGSDYITKPVSAEKILPRIELALKIHSQINNLTQETSNLTKTSMDFLSNIGEQGVVIEFLKKLNQIENFHDIRDTVLSSLEMFQLDGLVQIRHKNGHINIAKNETPLTALEKKVISQYDPQKPIQTFSKRLVVNYKNITLFIKNMPENDELIGRLRDHLASMISVASDKVDYLCKKQECNEYIRRSYSILEEIDSRRLKNTNKALSQMEDLLYRLEENFVAWGMSEEQEKQLITLVEQSLDESHQSNQEEKQLDSEQHRELSIILGILQNLG